MEVSEHHQGEIHAIPTHRLASEVGLLAQLPSMRLQVGPAPITRKVDKLSCIRFGSARYSVPNRFIDRVESPGFQSRAMTCTLPTEQVCGDTGAAPGPARAMIKRTQSNCLRFTTRRPSLRLIVKRNQLRRDRTPYEQ